MNFEYGDVTLDIQECALVSFNITGLMLNSSNVLNVEVTTNTTAQFDTDLTVTSDSRFYNINIDDSGTDVSVSANVVISIENIGIFNVTIESVYVNNTFISLGKFTITNYTFGPGDSIQLTISMDELDNDIGPVAIGETLEFIVRTKEGAEDILIETAQS